MEIEVPVGFQKEIIYNAIVRVFGGNSKTLTISHLIGDQVKETVLFSLGQLSQKQGFDANDVACLDLYFENANRAENVLVNKAREHDILVIDGCEHLERFPCLVEALRAREGQYKAIINLVVRPRTFEERMKLFL